MLQILKARKGWLGVRVNCIPFEVLWVLICGWGVCVSWFCCCLQEMRYWVELKLLGSSKILFGARQVGNWKRLRLKMKRCVYINDDDDLSHDLYCDNRISNTKYTLLNFLPKNLWEQFRYSLLFWSALRVATLENNYGILMFCFFIFDCNR